MPLYPYVCRSCGFEEERLVPASSAKQVICPKCGKKTFIREIGKPIGKLYTPDRDKILSTMEVKKTTYGANGEKLSTRKERVKM